MHMCAHILIKDIRTLFQLLQSRLCLTLPGVSSILSVEDEDEFASHQPLIMLLSLSSIGALDRKSGDFILVQFR